MRMVVHYICQYSGYENDRNLAFSPAGVTKMNYIIETLKKIGYSIRVYSTCSTKSKVGRVYRREEFRIDDQQTNIYCFTFGTNSKLLRLLERYINIFQLFMYLLFVVRSEDIVMVYHEMFYLPVIQFLRRLKKINLLYEVEELYLVVANRSTKEIQDEIDYLRMADAYVFSNDIMAEKCQLDKKPHIVCYGTYSIPALLSHKPNDGKIHVVYAGTLSIEKGGAAAAAAAAKFLPDNYHIHILGFGNQAQVDSYREYVAQLAGVSACQLTYDGSLLGDEYLQFLQKCDVGLSPQNPDASFNETSFPSKILSYLSNGLRVVSVRLNAIQKSKINDWVYYCTDNSPQAIAEAIEKVNLNDGQDSRAYIKELDEQFGKELKDLMIKMVDVQKRENGMDQECNYAVNQ